MGIRESLLNTITSVGNGDFIRIVTSAGASSKATLANVFKSFESGLGAKSSLTNSDYVRVVGTDNNSYKQTLGNVANTYEQNLGQKSSLTVNDYIRVVGTDNASYKQLVSDVAKKIIENYTGSSLAGSSQSVKSALDALNSKYKYLSWGNSFSFTLKKGALGLLIVSNEYIYALWNPADQLHANCVWSRTGGDSDITFTRATDNHTIAATSSASRTWGLLIFE